MPNSSPVGVMSIVLQLNAANYSDAITEAQRKLDGMAGKARAAGASTVSSMRAASATIRELNGDFANNIRAVEAFASTTLGLGPVFQKLFPVAGALAFTAIIGEGVKKIVEMVKEANGIPRALDLGFRSMILSQKLSNDEIDLSNAKIDAQRAKLEKKPINEMAIALHESYVEADKLAAKLQEDASKMDELMKKNQNGFFARMFMNKGATAGVDNAVDLGFQTRADLENRIALAPDDASRKQAEKELADYNATEMKRLRGEIAMRTGTVDRGPGSELSGPRVVPYASVNGTQTANLIVERAALALMTMQKDAPTPEATIVNPDKIKPDKPSTLKFDYEAEARENEKIHESLMQTWTELNRKDEEAAKIAAEGQVRMDELNKRAAESAAHYAEAQARVTEAYTKNGIALADLMTKHNLATAAISATTAAQQIAAQHRSAYRSELDSLDQQRGSLTQDDLNNGKGGDLDAKYAAIQGEMDRAALEDKWAEFQTTALGGASTALQEFTARATDAGAAVQSFLTGGINTINGAIVQDLTKPHGARSQFGAAGHEIFTSAAGSLLKGAEGSVLKALGIGKVDGSSSGKALWVRLAGMANPGAAADIGNGVISGTPGASAWLAAAQGQPAPGGGSNLSGMISTLLPLVASFDTGTNSVPHDMLALVHKGEEIKPYKASGSSGGDTHHYHIDARGSTDPAQVRYQVMQGIKEAAPHIVRASLRAGDERAARSPAGKRF